MCHRYGPPETLVVEDVPPLVAGLGEAVVAVQAASVNFPDVLIIQNKYQFKPPLPFSPGSEAAGIVSSVGEGVTNVRVGDRVMALTTHGGLAEEVKLGARQLVPIPDAMNFPTAAAFMLAYGTSDHALRDRGALRPGETVLVLGAAGGVGLAAIQIAKIVGARVIACASTDEKRAVCREHGADDVIDYEDIREHIRRLTNGHGLDVIYDPVGGAYTEPVLRSMAWRGRLLVVGFAAGEIPSVGLNIPLLKGCSIVGVFWGEFTKREPDAFRASMETLGRWYTEGRLSPLISATFPLERAAEALRMMADRQAKGKLVVLLNGDGALTT
jgi:NADPH2:quinone reductase